MSRLIPRSLRLLAVGPVLLLALLAYAEPLQAQRPPSIQSGGGLDGQVKDIWKEHQGYDPYSRRFTEAMFVWGGLAILATVIGAGLFFLKGSTWIFSRARGTSDMEKLAMSDPWIRAQLEARKAQGDAAPTEGQ